MGFFGWFNKGNLMNVLHRDHFELHKVVTDTILSLKDALKKLNDRVQKLEDNCEETQGDVRSLEKQVKGHEELAKGRNLLRNRITRTRQWLKQVHDRVSVLEGAGTERSCYQSGKSFLASDTVEQADCIKFEGERGISYVVGLIEERDSHESL